MKWKIDENYSIEKDAHAFSLKYYKIGDINPDTGKPVITKGEWYFPTINMCLKKYVQESLNVCNDAVIIFDRLEALNAKIDNLELPTFVQMDSETLSEES